MTRARNRNPGLQPRRMAAPPCDKGFGGGLHAERATRLGQAPISGPPGQVELQKLADETGLEIAVCHFPPGTSKWNKIEHRLFSAISQNWRGKPLVSHEVIAKLIAATTTRTGLRVRSELDENAYPAGIRVADADRTWPCRRSRP